jgi:hypothetical protein
MRRFELSDGSSNKFWEVEYVDSSDSFTVRWGRIGTNGQTPIWEMLKPLPNDLWATLHLPEGLWLSMMSETPIQILEHVQIRRGQYSYGETSLLQFGSLDPIVFSELVRDLESLKS